MEVTDNDKRYNQLQRRIDYGRKKIFDTLPRVHVLLYSKTSFLVQIKFITED